MQFCIMKDHYSCELHHLGMSDWGPCCWQKGDFKGTARATEMEDWMLLFWGWPAEWQQRAITTPCLCRLVICWWQIGGLCRSLCTLQFATLKAVLSSFYGKAQTSGAWCGHCNGSRDLSHQTLQHNCIHSHVHSASLQFHTGNNMLNLKPFGGLALSLSLLRDISHRRSRNHPIAPYIWP